MAKDTVEILSPGIAESYGQTAGAADIGYRAVPHSTASQGQAARRGQARLASFDFVTAVAVIGSVDMLQDQDTVIPPLDLSQTVLDEAAIDLTDLDLEQLMDVEIVPAPPLAENPDFDLGEMVVEQIFSFEVSPTDPAIDAQSDLTRVALEDLMQVEVKAAAIEETPPLDLTAIELETLQDLKFGEDAQRPETPYRQLVSLDLASPLDEADVNGRRPARAGPPNCRIPQPSTSWRTSRRATAPAMQARLSSRQTRSRQRSMISGRSTRTRR